MEKQIDYRRAYETYLDRFDTNCGEMALGAFVKFGRTMISKLSPDEFPARLDRYLLMHRTCKSMLESGATINDAMVDEFQDASCWMALEPPNVVLMFKGELGDPRRVSGVPPTEPPSPFADEATEEVDINVTIDIDPVAEGDEVLEAEVSLADVEDESTGTIRRAPLDTAKDERRAVAQKFGLGEKR